MTVRGRILAIKLLEKQERNPEYARQIGIQVSIIKKDLKITEVKNVWTISTDFILLDILWLNPINVQSCLGTGKDPGSNLVHYGATLTDRLPALCQRRNPAVPGHFDRNCLGHFKGMYLIVPIYWTIKQL